MGGEASGACQPRPGCGRVTGKAGDPVKKSILLREILEALSPEEWKALEEGKTAVPVNGYNREVLLELRAREEDFAGEAEEGRVLALREAVDGYLERYWPEEPGAHKYVTLVCLALTFLYEKPMHPPEKAGYRQRIENGTVRYFCPAREEGEDSVCRFCLTEPMGVLEARWEALAAETARKDGEISALVQRAAFRAGFQESGVLDTGALRFHEEVRRICEENRCRSYGRSWACPPAAGTLDQCRERVLGYEKLLLFSKAYLLPDSMDFSAVGKAMKDFKACALDLGRELRPRLNKLLILSNEGCMRCAQCTWPEAPCRFPEELQPSIEGFGFLVSELAQQAGIPYLSGPNTVTFFGAALYDEA